MASRRLDPDTALEISLNGTAGRLAGDGTPMADAVTQLREIANGRTDLLATAAAGKLGGYLGRPGATNPLDLLAVAYLAIAGADARALVEYADVVRGRVSRIV